MRLEERIKKLESTFAGSSEKVFSLYLNVDPRDPEQQGGKWKIRLKKALNTLEESTKNSTSNEGKNQAKAVREKVENFIHGKANEFKRGLILFVTADENLWVSFDLNIPVTSEFHWDDSPHFEQLKSLLKKHPYSGLLILQQDKAQLIETEMGELLNTSYYQLDLETDNWKQHQGSESNDLIRGGSKRDEFNERVKAHQDRWFKNLAEKIQKKAKESNWKQFHLIGEREEVEHLKSYFTRKIDKIVPRNLLGRNANQIIEETFK